MADAPTSISSLAVAVDKPEPEVEKALSELGATLDQAGGLQLVRIAGGYQLCTRPDLAEVVAKFLKPQKQRLGRSVMEVLAIVAYRQPITMAEIDAIRGVQSDYGIRQLIERRLIREVARKQSPGRPMLLGTTQQFLHVFGLNSLEELPSLQLPAVAEHPIAAEMV